MGDPALMINRGWDGNWDAESWLPTLSMNGEAAVFAWVGAASSCHLAVVGRSAALDQHNANAVIHVKREAAAAIFNASWRGADTHFALTPAPLRLRVTFGYGARDVTVSAPGFVMNLTGPSARMRISSVATPSCFADGFPSKGPQFTAHITRGLQWTGEWD